MTNKITLQRITGHCGLLLLIALSTSITFGAELRPAMSKADVKQLIGKASTPEDHHRLAAYFTQKAVMMDAEAVEHEELAKEYASHPGLEESKHPMSGTTAAHCKYFAQAARKAAIEDRALASGHEEMAKKSQK